LLISALGGALIVVIAGFALYVWLNHGGDSERAGQTLPPNPATLVQNKTTTADGGEPLQPTPAHPAGEATGSNPPIVDETNRPGAGSKPALVESAAASTRPVAAVTSPLQLIVPAYFYPSGEGLKSWQRMIDAAARVRIVTIANPANGPGEQRNPDYFLITQAASDKGVRVIGYVATGYAKRPLSEVKNEIDRWIEFYPHISGFFLDQQSPSGQNINYYIKVRDHARQRIKSALIITNPGAMCDEEYFVQGVSDVICVFANFQGFAQLDLPTLLRQYSPTRFAALVYNISSAAAMNTVVKDASSKRIGYLYVVDSPQGDNPYAKLPVYWDEEVSAMAREK
jgi:hypothetical protein